MLFMQNYETCQTPQGAEDHVLRVSVAITMLCDFLNSVIACGTDLIIVSIGDGNECGESMLLVGFRR